MAVKEQRVDGSWMHKTIVYFKVYSNKERKFLLNQNPVVINITQGNIK